VALEENQDGVTMKTLKALVTTEKSLENLDGVLSVAKKQKYKLSASLINSYLYHMNTQSENSKADFVNRLKGIYTSNFYLKRGKKYEKEVSAGMHKKISEKINHLPKEVWLNGVLKHPSFILKLSGKMDAWDPDNGIIYDTKRVDSYYEGKYDDDVTIQHILYFYLNKEAKQFIYLVAAGKNDTVDNYVEHVVKRPSEKYINKTLLETIVLFINYLKYENLWEVYTTNQKAKY